MKSQKNKNIFFVVNVDWFFLSHRLLYANYLERKGFNIIVLTLQQTIHEKDFPFKIINLSSSRDNISIFKEILPFLKIIYYLTKLKPVFVYNIALKSVLISSLACKTIGFKKHINLLTGLGFLFINRKNHTKLFKVVILLLKFSLDDSKIKVITQNKIDNKYFKKLLKKTNNYIVKGSGVDLSLFKYSKPNINSNKIIFIGRLLHDKGIIEFSELAKSNPKYEFIILGDIDLKNKNSISNEELNELEKIPNLQFHGKVNNVEEYIKNAYVIIHPSYREGLSRALIEVNAIGRPSVVSDVAGNIDIIKNGYNGFHFKNKNIISLNEIFNRITNLESEHYIKMCENARITFENEYSSTIINEKLFRIQNR